MCPSSNESQRKVRVLTATSCNVCRARKTRCGGDGDSACGFCTSRGLSCVYPTRRARKASLERSNNTSNGQLTRDRATLPSLSPAASYSPFRDSRANSATAFPANSWPAASYQHPPHYTNYTPSWHTGFRPQKAAEDYKGDPRGMQFTRVEFPAPASVSSLNPGSSPRFPVHWNTNTLVREAVSGDVVNADSGFIEAGTAGGGKSAATSDSRSKLLRRLSISFLLNPTEPGEETLRVKAEAPYPQFR